MELAAAIEQVKSRFSYQPDRLRVFDSWRVMILKDGNFRGDCEDFALTVFWYVADKNMLRFLCNLLITHRFRMVRVRTAQGEAHVVGNLRERWFDNFTLADHPREHFFQVTNHEKLLVYPGPLIALYLLLGLVFK